MIRVREELHLDCNGFDTISVGMDTDDTLLIEQNGNSISVHIALAPLIVGKLQKSYRDAKKNGNIRMTLQELLKQGYSKK